MPSQYPASATHFASSSLSFSSSLSSCALASAFSLSSFSFAATKSLRSSPVSCRAACAIKLKMRYLQTRLWKKHKREFRTLPGPTASCVSARLWSFCGYLWSPPKEDTAAESDQIELNAFRSSARCATKFFSTSSKTTWQQMCPWKALIGLDVSETWTHERDTWKKWHVFRYPFWRTKNASIFDPVLVVLPNIVKDQTWHCWNCTQPSTDSMRKDCKLSHHLQSVEHPVEWFMFCQSQFANVIPSHTRIYDRQDFDRLRRKKSFFSIFLTDNASS